MKLTNKLIALALAVMMIVSLCSLATSADDVTPFRVNVSRIEMGNVSNANMGTYFIFDGQEGELNNNLYSRAVLADWDASANAYKITASLGYENDKTDWDIPATGFALMISSFADGNSFDRNNFSLIGTNFSYKTNEKDNFLAGSYIYLYNIDLAEGTVMTSGTEGAEDFTSESYVMIGSEDATATTEPYVGGTSITKMPAPNSTNTIWISHYDMQLGLYKEALGTADTDDIYDETFIINPMDYETEDDLSEVLDLCAYCFSAILEPVDAENNIYKVLHTSGWEDKTEWAYSDSEYQLFTAENTPNPNRLVLMCMVMNQSEEGKYGWLTYNFGALNVNAAYYGLGAGYGACPADQGSFLGQYATFVNVDIPNKKVQTSGEWGTDDFMSESFVVFTDSQPEPHAFDTTTGATTTTTEVKADNTTAKTTVSTTVSAPAEDTDSSNTQTIVIIAIIVAVVVIAAIVVVVVLKKKKKNA